VRFAIGEISVLEPFSESVEQRFESWLQLQREAGKDFTEEQMEWLRMIKDHIATSLTIGLDDFEYSPFYERGGALRAYRIFGDDLDKTLEDLNEVLVA